MRKHLFKFVVLLISFSSIYYLYTSHGIGAQIKKNKPVIITGNNVKSKLDQLIGGIKHYLTELTGNPKIKSGNIIIHSEKIIIRGKDSEIAECIGKVVIIDKMNNSVLRCKKAIYYKQKNIVEVRGNLNIIYNREDDNSKIHLKANKIIYNMYNKIANAYGNVTVKDNEIKIFAKRANFNRMTKKIIFRGKPFIRKDDDTYRAEEIICFMDKKDIILNKKVHVTTISEEKDEKTGEIRKVRADTNCDRIEHFDNEEKLSRLTGNAVIKREGAIFHGKMFEIRGKDSENVIGENVNINYETDNTDGYGDYFRYYKNKGYAMLWGNSMMMIKNKKSTEEKVRIYGDLMEFYQDIDELYINGNVKIFHSSSIIYGDMARYIRKNNQMIITGNPSAKKDDSLIMADTIVFNTENNDTKLLGNIRGSADNRGI